VTRGSSAPAGGAGVAGTRRVAAARACRSPLQVYSFAGLAFRVLLRVEGASGLESFGSSNAEWMDQCLRSSVQGSWMGKAGKLSRGRMRCVMRACEGARKRLLTFF